MKLRPRRPHRSPATTAAKPGPIHPRPRRPAAGPGPLPVCGAPAADAGPALPEHPRFRRWPVFGGQEHLRAASQPATELPRRHGHAGHGEPGREQGRRLRARDQGAGHKRRRPAQGRRRQDAPARQQHAPGHAQVLPRQVRQGCGLAGRGHAEPEQAPLRPDPRAQQAGLRPDAPGALPPKPAHAVRRDPLRRGRGHGCRRATHGPVHPYRKAGRQELPGAPRLGRRLQRLQGRRVQLQPGRAIADAGRRQGRAGL